MIYSIEILNDKAIKLLLHLEEMQLIRLEKKETIPDNQLQQKRSFGGRISKKSADDWQKQLNSQSNH